MLGAELDLFLRIPEKPGLEEDLVVGILTDGAKGLDLGSAGFADIIKGVDFVTFFLNYRKYRIVKSYPISILPKRYRTFTHNS